MNPSELTAEYIGGLTAALREVPVEVIVRIAGLLAQARATGRTVLVFGNGGSSAIASHLAVDLNKTAIHPDHPRLRAIALTDNVPLITAWANDTTYANIFVEQMRNFIQPGDVAVAISSSGRSPNILEAVRFARAAGAVTVGLAGFDGGELPALVDVCLVVRNQNYGQIEDAHQAVAHMVTALLRSGIDLSGPVSGPAGPAPAVFLDRDGTIIEDVTYLRHPDEVRLLPRAAEGIAVLNRSGLPVIVATNQSVLGRGMIDVAMLDAIHVRLLDVLSGAGARIDAIYVCPHHPDDGCACRKPRPGLLLRAAAERHLDLTASFMVGDRPLDILAGQAAGCRTVLVETGPPGAWDDAAGAVPDVRARDLLEAARWIASAAEARSG